MEVIKKVESREDYKKWLLDTHGVFCIKGFSEEPNTSIMPDTAKLALIQEFFREEKGVYIQVIQDMTHDDKNNSIHFNGYFCAEIVSNYGCRDLDDVKGYSQALAKGIEEALKLIDPNN